MLGVVVAAHGALADALVSTASLVVRDHGPAAAVGFGTDDDTASYQQRLQDAVASMGEERGILLLTDMFGGTPSNVALTMHQSGKVEVLTGANLAMLIKALQLTDKEVPLAVAARKVKDYGAQAIAIASEVLGIGEPARASSDDQERTA